MFLCDDIPKSKCYQEYFTPMFLTLPIYTYLAMQTRSGWLHHCYLDPSEVIFARHPSTAADGHIQTAGTVHPLLQERLERFTFLCTCGTAKLASHGCIYPP
jgi:hypothetical protein